MTIDTETGQSGPDGTTTGTPPDTQANGGTREDVVPASRLRGLIKQNEELTAKLAKHEQDQEQRKRQALEEEGKYQEVLKLEQTRAGSLAEQLEATNAQLEKLRKSEEKRIKAIAEQNRARVEKLPEHLRALAPVNYSPDELSAWLSNAEHQFGLEVSYADRAASGPAAPTRPISDDEWRERYRQMSREKMKTGTVNNHGS